MVCVGHLTRYTEIICTNQDSVFYRVSPVTARDWWPRQKKYFLVQKHQINSGVRGKVSKNSGCYSIISMLKISKENSFKGYSV